MARQRALRQPPGDDDYTSVGAPGSVHDLKPGAPTPIMWPLLLNPLFPGRCRVKRSHYVSIFVVLVAIAMALPTMATQKVTVTGEVIDSACFIRMGAHGEGHRDCAQTCADNGIPLALLEAETEQVIWLASSESMQSPNDALKAHASHTVKITGEYAERGGVKILVIEEIEHVSR